MSHKYGRALAPGFIITSDGNTATLRDEKGAALEHFPSLDRRRFLRRMEWAIRGGIGFLAFVFGAIYGRAQW